MDIGDAIERDTDLLFIDVIWIVKATVPLQRLLLLAAAFAFYRGGDGIEEVIIAGYATAILWRTATFAAKEGRVEFARAASPARIARLRASKGSLVPRDRQISLRLRIDVKSAGTETR